VFHWTTDNTVVEETRDGWGWGNKFQRRNNFWSANEKVTRLKHWFKPFSANHNYQITSGFPTKFIIFSRLFCRSQVMTTKTRELNHFAFSASPKLRLIFSGRGNPAACFPGNNSALDGEPKASKATDLELGITCRAARAFSKWGTWDGGCLYFTANDFKIRAWMVEHMYSWHQQALILITGFCYWDGPQAFCNVIRGGGRLQRTRAIRAAVPP